MNHHLYRLRQAVMIGFVCALLTATVTESAFAQRKSIKQYVHHIWNVDNGFPQNSASDILQTRDGYLWFATQDGMARFDGLKFTVFDRTNTKAFPSSWAVAALEDSTGALWIRPSGFAPGLVRYAGGEFTRIDTSTGLPSNRAITWVVDPPAAIWIGTDRGLARYENGAFTVYTVKDGLPGDSIWGLGRDSRGTIWTRTSRGVAWIKGGKVELVTGRPDFPDTTTGNLNRWESTYQDSRGTVWVRTPRGLAGFDGTSFTQYTDEGLVGPVVNCIHEDAKGVIWLGTTTGMKRFTGGRFESVRVSENPDENIVYEIREDKEGSLWLRTDKGIARYAGGAIERYHKKDGLSDDSPQRIFIDREGSIWVSTFGGGVDQFRDEKFVTYSSSVGLSYDNVQALYVDRTGALWVGTSFGALNAIRNGVVTVYGAQQGFGGENVSAMGEDREGAIWITTNKGLYSFRDGKFTLRSKGSGASQFPWGNRVLQLRSGRFLVASQNALYEYRGGNSFDSLLTVGGVPESQTWIRELFEDSRGRLWIGTLNALYYYEKGSLTRLSEEEGAPGRWVQAFHEDADGTLWLGISDAGLARYKNGTFVLISPEQGLFDYSAYTILDDGKGYFWMSCNRGVYRARKDELNQVADGKRASVVCNVYGMADGMGSRECNGGYSSAGVKLLDGRLAFSTTRGVTIVNPADIRINPLPPSVVLERFVVEGVPQDVRSDVRIEPGKRRLEFHYAGISFAGAPQVKYRYQLVGLDKEWIEAGSRREAYYTQLDPGTYTFRVIAANSDGVWNEQGASLAFEMQPFFYQSSWFIGIVLLIFLTSGPSFYLYRMGAMKKRRAELERQVQERTSELRKTVDNLKETQNQLILSEKMASLGQLTAGIAHEIKNPLNFINNFAVLSQDLTADLRKELLAEKERVDKKRALEIEELLRDLEQNVSKINEHGKRADSIVRGMLLHSRGKPGERQQTDLNALLAEYTNLAYHGMRAQDHSFNVKIETEFDPTIGTVNVVPQDLSRAFLNIVNNACYAANDKRRNAQNGFSPVVRVSAKNIRDKVEIRIRDNGNGIPEAIRERIFNPFFTTKPAGVGTGLGLSLSYDIITQVHKGTIQVDTQPGEYTEFVITIPRDTDEDGGSRS